MIVKTILHTRRSCANIICGNAVGEGTYAVVALTAPPISNKGVVLIVCAPCAEIIERARDEP